MKDNRQLFLPLRVFASLRPPYSELKSAKVVILPVPYDSTTTWRSGTRYGPQSIIDASQYLELYDLELDREIYKVGIHTLPEVEPMMNSPEEMVTRVYLITKELVKKGKFVRIHRSGEKPFSNRQRSSWIQAVYFCEHRNDLQ